MADEPRLDVKVIDYWGPVCDGGRHNQPHPGETCDEADEWITLRNKILRDFFAQAFAQMVAGSDAATMAGTAFAAAVADPVPTPERTDIQRALDILGPHLAWQPLYRA
ncbi:hypothetical protein AB5J55_35200 [Streptomyces sp. R11]|uniref:Uncharacterized protein n=1 Tax=Streptomyces sp. R11 TaxID=3238625 RepID=A0AB39NAV8_9ACTN